MEVRSQRSLQFFINIGCVFILFRLSAAGPLSPWLHNKFHETILWNAKYFIFLTTNVVICSERFEIESFAAMGYFEKGLHNRICLSFRTLDVNERAFC